MKSSLRHVSPKAPGGGRLLGTRHITERTCDLSRSSVTDLNRKESMEGYVPSIVMSPPNSNDGLQVKTRHGNIGAQGR
jgi:hypothetical protein